MNKIKLTEEQLTVLKRHLEGKYDPFMASEEEMNNFNEVIEMAENLMFDLDAIEESGDDLMLWFLNKYENQ